MTNATMQNKPMAVIATQIRLAAKISMLAFASTPFLDMKITFYCSEDISTSWNITTLIVDLL
jgi:myo-inositol-1-phosphate synthase